MGVWSIVGVRRKLRDAALVVKRRGSALSALTSEDERQQLLAEAMAIEE